MRAAAIHAIQTILHRIRFAITVCDKMLSYWHSTINTTTTSATTSATLLLPLLFLLLPAATITALLLAFYY